MEVYIENLNWMFVVWNLIDEMEICDLIEIVFEYNVYFVDFNYNIIGCEVFIEMVYFVYS